MNKNIQGYCWFSGISTIGLVVVQVDDKLKAYISTVKGDDQNQDLQKIIDYGTYFPLEEANSIIDKLGIWLNAPQPPQA